MINLNLVFQCLFKHYKCITGVVVNKRHNGPCVGEERLTDNDQFNGPLVKEKSCEIFNQSKTLYTICCKLLNYC